MTRDEAKTKGYDFDTDPNPDCTQCEGEGLLYGVNYGDVNLGVWECFCTWSDDE